ncbi:MAG: beta-ketoacyl-[acyl-carrier-protein] synthase family protein [Schlesneria sp.]
MDVARKSCRIVVTGIGLCTPLGPDRETSWPGLLSGRSATRWLDAPQWTESSQMAGAPTCLPKDRPFRHREPIIELALTTANESLFDAGLDRQLLEELCAAVVFGTSKGGFHTFSRLLAEQRTDVGHSLRSESNENSADWLDVFPNRAATAIGSMIGCYGPILCPIAACATGLAACLRGAELIQNGDCDIALVGSADVSLQPALLGSFRRLGVLSRESHDPSRACRPFDRHRTGFVIGEGAACLVLERQDSALKRGAHCYAEWLGGKMLSDPYGLTQLDTSGTSLRKLLADLRSLTSRNPDYVNLHGTGTVANDTVECQAIRAVFGNETDEFDCSSLKGAMGHLLGAAGSVELAVTALSIRDQIVAPTVNLIEPDSDCLLNLTPGKPKLRSIDHAWKLSMGFGGHIAGVCLGRLEQPSAGSGRKRLQL